MFAKKQKEVPIIYQSLVIAEGLRLDLLVEDLIIVEFKVQENFHPVWEAQVLSYLKLTGKRLGFDRFSCTINERGYKKNNSLNFVSLCAFGP